MGSHIYSINFCIKLKYGSKRGEKMKKKLILLCFVIILFIILENKCYATILYPSSGNAEWVLQYIDMEDMKSGLKKDFKGDNGFLESELDNLIKKRDIPNFVVNANIIIAEDRTKIRLNDKQIGFNSSGVYSEVMGGEYTTEANYFVEAGEPYQDNEEKFYSVPVRVLLQISKYTNSVQIKEIHFNYKDDEMEANDYTNNSWNNGYWKTDDSGVGVLYNSSGSEIEVPLSEKIMEPFETFAILKAKLESILGYWEQMIESFEKRPIPTVLNYVFINGIRFIFDGLQLGMNFLQMHYLDTGMDFSLLYNYDLLVEDSGASNNGEQDKGQGHRDLYSKVSEYSDSKKEWQIKTNIESIDDDGNDWGFTMGTQIPVVSVDLYNMALNNIDYFDINFFNPNRIKERGMIGHKEDGGWIRFKKIVELAIRLLIYISAILMLFLLVWNGIKITSKVITDPRQKAKAQNNFTNILISTFLLVGVVVYMALCINISDWMWDISNNAGRDPYEGFIRVNVTNEGEGVYSFSTTFTGFVRYLLQTENLDILHIKVLILALYVIIVIVNIVMFLFMCMRTLMIVWLAIIGIINTLKISLNMYTSKDVTWKSDYIKWARDFFIYSSVHLVLIIVLNGIIAFNKV